MHHGGRVLPTTCFHYNLVARLWGSSKYSLDPNCWPLPSFTEKNLDCTLQFALGLFAIMSRGVSEPGPRCPNTQAIALPLPVGRGQDASSATSLKAFTLQPQPGSWPEALRLAMGWLGESRARVENASGFLNPLETAVLESHLLWVLHHQRATHS